MQRDRFPLSRAVRDPARPDISAATPARVASGIVEAGDEVVVLPSGADDAHQIDRNVRRAARARRPSSGDAVVLTTDDELDMSRGDMIVRRAQPADGPSRARRRISAGWHATPLARERDLRADAHHAAGAGARYSRSHYRIDVDTLHREPAAYAGDERHRPRRDHHRPIAVFCRFVPAERGRPAASSWSIRTPTSRSRPA